MSNVQLADVVLDEHEQPSSNTEPTWIPKDLEKVEIDPAEFVEESIHTDKGKLFFRYVILRKSVQIHRYSWTIHLFSM